MPEDFTTPTHPAFIFVRLLHRIPIRCTLNGEQWEISVDHGGKNGAKECLYAECIRGRHRTYQLTHYGRRDSGYRAAEDGFIVKWGSPEHGLCTALRRAGIVEFNPNRR